MNKFYMSSSDSEQAVCFLFTKTSILFYVRETCILLVFNLGGGPQFLFYKRLIIFSSSFIEV